MKNNKPELLSPGGSYEKAKYALDFGADAVYCGVNLFALRTYEGNFNNDELEKIIKYAMDKYSWEKIGEKTCNLYKKTMNE